MSLGPLDVGRALSKQSGWGSRSRKGNTFPTMTCAISIGVTAMRLISCAGLTPSRNTIIPSAVRVQVLGCKTT